MTSPPYSLGNRAPTVAVIGAGFSGLLTTLHLLRGPCAPRVILLERGPVFGRGAAYATDNPDHLLNVRVENMSAFPDQPRHFVEWLSRRDNWSSRAGFVTRRCYGDYLQDLLRQATADAAPGRLLLEADQVMRLTRLPGGWRLDTQMGRELEADAVVLATGLLPPETPPGAEALIGSPNYVADPWAGKLAAPAGSDVLLLGAGLTMVDVALSLSGERRKLTALSRRGLLPQTHAANPAPAPAPAGGPAALTRWVRRAALGQDWRTVIDGLRPHVQSIWQGWSLGERRQFLRHLRPWWEAHRHRMAPAVARRITTLRQLGDLTVHGGRVVACEHTGGRVAVTWLPRGTHEPKRTIVDLVVNCTGPAGDLTRTNDPLLIDLIAQGRLRPDPCRLGVEVDGLARPIGASGMADAALFAVGPLTRGAVWEMTSVPDIRLQARQVADHVSASFAPVEARQAV
jgi:uncharacterized NAD(P)/FAD-binding protein YdhS